MKLRKICTLLFLLLVSIISIRCVEIYANENSGYRALANYDCHNSEIDKEYIADSYKISVKEDGLYENIIINVESYDEYTKKIYADQNKVLYKFYGVKGKSIISSETSLKGEYIDKITLAKTTSGILQVVIHYKNNVDYSFDEEDGFVTKLKYNSSYQKFLDKKLQEKKENNESENANSKVEFSEEFSKQLDEYFNGPVLYANYEIDEHIASLKIPGLILTNQIGEKLYTASYNKRTKKLFIHFNKNIGNINVEQLSINDYIINNISISTDLIRSGMTTIVIDSEEQLYYEQNEDYEEGFELLLSTRPIPDDSEIDKIQDPIVEEDDINDEFIEKDDEPVVEAKHVADLKIAFYEGFIEDEVVIDLENISGYNVFRMSEPERIVIDLKGIFLEKHLVELVKNTDYIDKIRYARFNEQTARVVLDLKNPSGYSSTYSPQNNYRYEIEDGNLHIYVTNRIFDKYYYSNANDRVYLLLMGEYLSSSEVYPLKNKMYTSSYNNTTDIYKITYKSSLGYNGRMQINDDYVEYINAYSRSGETTLTIKLKDSTVEPLPLTRYMKTSSGYKYYHSTITFVKKKQPGEKIIVIDAGHGGADPGTTSASYLGTDMLEKNVNLDMANRLERMLEEKGYTVYMTREDDSYVGLGERANTANMMNADLFLSIHNNAYYKSFHGTETFHFPYPESDPGINCIEFANLLQSELIKELKLYDRGVKEAEFSVLKYTNMPSCLVEIGFLSNPDEAKLIMQPSFRERTAEALYKAIVEALSRIR